MTATRLPASPVPVIDCWRLHVAIAGPRLLPLSPATVAAALATLGQTTSEVVLTTRHGVAGAAIAWANQTGARVTLLQPTHPGQTDARARARLLARQVELAEVLVVISDALGLRQLAGVLAAGRARGLPIVICDEQGAEQSREPGLHGPNWLTAAPAMTTPEAEAARVQARRQRHPKRPAGCPSPHAGRHQSA